MNANDAPGRGEDREIDPLRRVFVPIERINPHGVPVFRTMDGTRYYRDARGCIRRAVEKTKLKRG